MNERVGTTNRETDDGVLAPGAFVEAARERQSHVRHDLRAPLAVMYPLLSLLLDGGAGELTAQQRDYLEVLERNVMRLEALICGVADSGWADCSSAPPVSDAVSLSDVVDDVIAMRRIEARSGLQIDVRTGPRPLPRAWADRNDVYQIVSDLLGNATAYTPADGSVTVRLGVGHDPGAVEIEIADTGPGIPADELPRVFEFGFRGEMPRSLRIPGLGAGLWVCRELAARNGGHLRLVSEPGCGVTVTVVLPAAESGRSQPVEEAPELGAM